MKTVSITVLILLACLLLASLFTVGGPVQAGQIQAGPVETTVPVTSVEEKTAGTSLQPAPVVTAVPAGNQAASPTLAPDLVYPQAAAAKSFVINRQTARESVPVSSASLSDAVRLVVPTPAAAPVIDQPMAALAAKTALEDQQLEAFTASVINGQADQVVGVFVPGIFALPVLQQPEGQAGYVSEQDDTITQFSAPKAHDTIGLLAHNYLSGQRFFELVESQVVVIIHGDGHRENYQINKIQQFQALSPTSVYSDFIDLADPTKTVISAGTLYNRVYTTPGQVVFQTCIEANGDASWGRIFISAEPVLN